MAIDEARVWLQRHAENAPMPGAREAYKTILEALERTRWISVDERKPDDGAVVIAAARHNIAGYTFWEKCVACWDSDAATFHLIDCDKRFAGEYWMQLPEVEP